MESMGQEVTRKAKQSLIEQLDLLAKASQRCKPYDLVRLSEAMVLVARELRCG